MASIFSDGALLLVTHMLDAGSETGATGNVGDTIGTIKGKDRISGRVTNLSSFGASSTPPIAIVEPDGACGTIADGVVDALPAWLRSLASREAWLDNKLANSCCCAAKR